MSNPTHIGQRGIELIKQFEGLVLHAYDDLDPKRSPIMPGDEVKGTLTIGYGHTGPDVHPEQTISEKEADALLLRDLEFTETFVRRNVTSPIRQNQFDAMVSLAYNIGVGNFAKSSVLRRTNIGDYHGAAEAFTMWVSSKGRVLPGLERRRKAEQALYNRMD